MRRWRKVSICPYCFPNQGCHVCGNAGYFANRKTIDRMVADFEENTRREREEYLRQSQERDAQIKARKKAERRQRWEVKE